MKVVLKRRGLFVAAAVLAVAASAGALAGGGAAAHSRGLSVQGTPVRQIVRVLCGRGTPVPKVPADSLATAYGLTCARFSGSRCEVWAKRLSHPPYITRQLHYRVAASFCAYARTFLVKHPKGYAIEVVTPGPHHR
jgi:hypothetical protein